MYSTITMRQNTPKQTATFLLQALFFTMVLFTFLPSIFSIATAEANILYKDECGDYGIQPITFTKDKDLNLQIKEYPNFGGQTLNSIAGNEETQNIPSIVSYLYSATLVLSAIIAFFAILYTGLMFSVSGANPELRKQAITRVKKIFIGITIVLFSVLILNEINPGLTSLENLSIIEQENDIEKYAVPDGGTEEAVQRRDIDNDIQEGLPFSSSEATEAHYADIAVPLSNEGDEEENDGAGIEEENKTCKACNEGGGYNAGKQICSPFCYDKNIEDYKEKDGEEDSQTELRDKYMVIGLDRLKCWLDAGAGKKDEEGNTTYTKWALVKDDDDPIVSCVAACAVIKGETYIENLKETCAQYEMGANRKEIDAGIERIQKSVNKALNDVSKRDNFKEDIEDDNQWYDGKIPDFDNGYIFWDDTNSAGKNDLKLYDGTSDKTTLNRKPLRECISNHLLYEAQEWPQGIVGNTNVDICLCK